MMGPQRLVEVGAIQVTCTVNAGCCPHDQELPHPSRIRPAKAKPPCMLKHALFLLLALSPVHSEELFPSIPLPQAQHLSQQQQKPILVEFSASWCATCKAMQRTTFSDPAVIEYARSHFVPLQLDLDKDNEQAKKLGVSTVPTLIVLDQGKELDRLTGLQKTPKLLAWLRNVGQRASSDMPAESQQSLLRFARTNSHRQWSNLLTALDAAERSQEAQTIRIWILETDPEARLEAE